MRPSASSTLVAIVVGILVGTSLDQGRGAEIDYNRDIRPILSRHCLSCHGPDEGSREADLRLDRRDDSLRDRDGYAVIVPGDPESSELFFRVSEEDELVRMPPKGAGKALGPAEVDLLRRWIEQGADYAEHWAFVAPRDRPLPEVGRAAWPRNVIDRWVLARMDEAGLEPSPEADRFTLLRRLSLDLRGLPPGPDEVEAFARDESPDAYEQAVDRFLADRAFGERWARVWLDLARYADSAGYGSDPLRPDMYRYRDWVIGALNANIPYDRFTVEQIAGDLLPEPTTDQRLATAFHRNAMTNTEGGTDDEEFRVAAIKDRGDTTAQVWMGLTMGCAKCHTHKYDPISHEEYYRFYAFFNQSADTDKNDERPVMPAPTPAIAEEIRRVDAEIAALRREIDAPSPEIDAAQARWAADLKTRPDWVVLESQSARSESGASLAVLPDGSILASGLSPDHEVYRVSGRIDRGPIVAFRLESLPDPSLPGGGAGRGPDGDFVLSRFGVETTPNGEEVPAPIGRFVRIEAPGVRKVLSLIEVQVFGDGENLTAAGSAEQSSTEAEGEASLALDGDSKAKGQATQTLAQDDPWWQVRLAEPRGIDRIVLWIADEGGPDTLPDRFRVRVLGDTGEVAWEGPAEVVGGRRKPLELSPTGRRSVSLSGAAADLVAKGFAIDDALKPTATTKSGWSVGPGQAGSHEAIFLAGSPADTAKPGPIEVRLDHRYQEPGRTLGRFRISVTNNPAAASRAELPATVLAVIDTPDDRRTPADREALARHFRSIVPELKPIRDRIAALEKGRPKVPNVPIMVELPTDQRRVTRILNKGDFLDPGQVVEPGVPAFLHPLPEGAPADRLGLARWLVDPANPLTARVAANRCWSHLFGVGLVESEEDFGTQGEPPSHPGLLDWLALEYVRLGWDTKALIRTIVTSATYRQSSKVSPLAFEVDPRNRLLARGPRYRLDAETVRDQALALSGLLSREIGGPSVFPPQPEGLWQAAFNGQRTWTTSLGDDRHRRGLYTFWRRTIPYPSMAAFDAPSREICAVRRIRSNTPLQAFVTLNDPVYVEAAQALARRIVAEGGSTVEDRVRFGLRLCQGRPADSDEAEVLIGLFATELDHYREHPEAAHALATDPLGPLPPGLSADEMAAWTTIANVLLNLDAVLTKG